MYVCDTEGWPKHMHLKFEHFEQEMPFNRTPLSEHVEQLIAQQQQQQQQEKERQQRRQPPSRMSAEGSSLPATARSVGSDASEEASEDSSSSPPIGRLTSDSSSGEALVVGTPPSDSASAEQLRPLRAASLQRQHCFLRDARISELHPASWFAVAWYPVYRIPDAPLCARFLTFHSFAPLVISMQRALSALQQGQHRPVAIMPLQVVGLKWYNMHGERWLEPIGDEEAARQQQPQDSRRRSRQQDLAWQAHLRDLQGNAERMARGQGLRVLGQMGAKEVRQNHPDFEFFNVRS